MMSRQEIVDTRTKLMSQLQNEITKLSQKEDFNFATAQQISELCDEYQSVSERRRYDTWFYRLSTGNNESASE